MRTMPKSNTSLPVALTTPAASARAFRRLRWNLWSNTVRGALRGSRLRMTMIAFSSAVFWTGLFVLFFGGFQFVAAYVSLTNEIVEYLFGLFFLSLLAMLFLSNGILVYTGLYESREADFLLTTPAPADRIFAYKFGEAVLFSSWGFLLLGSPLMAAYGITVNASGWFYLIFAAYLVGFVLIPASLGATAAILIAYFLPRRRKSVLAVLVGLMVAGGVWIIVSASRAKGDALSSDWLDGLLSRLAFTQYPLWPSRWMSTGLVSAARGSWSDSLFYLMVIAAHAALAYLIAAVVARDLYRGGHARVQGGRSSRKRLPNAWLEAAFHRVFGILPRPIRLLLLKDLRTFARDPAQWSQFLIFFGLLAFYFVNIRRLSHDQQPPYWRNLVSLLNLGVTALILSTFTSRFIFPLLSLEGRNFWILGLLPLRREAILWGKFVFSAGISLVATEFLVVLSDLMLRMSAAMIALHVGMVAILCLGLSGISVGLGARLPNLKETDPSKIAAGFGGTLNLLVSLVFILAVVLTLAVPCHLYLAGRDPNDFAGLPLSEGRFQLWMGFAIGFSLVVGAAATIVPLRIGIKAFQRMEF